MVKICPKCKLVNPDSALRCDCGWDFSSQTIESSFLTGKQQAKLVQDAEQPTLGQIIICLLFPFIGLLYAAILAYQGKPKWKYIGVLSGAVFLILFIIKLLAPTIHK